MIRAGKPSQWIAHQLGHVGVKKIDEVYGRQPRTPEEEAADLDAFFLQTMGLPKKAVGLQGLPNLSQTDEASPAPLPENIGYSSDFSASSAPAGSRTRTIVRRKQDEDRQNSPHKYNPFAQRVCSVGGREVTFCR
jgi:hypothetical protein